MASDGRDQQALTRLSRLKGRAAIPPLQERRSRINAQAPFLFARAVTTLTFRQKKRSDRTLELLFLVAGFGGVVGLRTSVQRDRKHGQQQSRIEE
jgi:hypothetical protein